MQKKPYTIINKNVDAVIFDANKYPNASEDFTKAVQAGDVMVLDIDEDSYTMFYNIQNSVFQTAELFGQSIHLGTAKGDVFISIDEMDASSSESDSEPYQSREDGFNMGLAYRQSQQAA